MWSIQLNQNQNTKPIDHILVQQSEITQYILKLKLL